MLKFKTTLAAVAATSLLASGAHAASMIIDDFDQMISAGVPVSGLVDSAVMSDMYTSPDMIAFTRTLSVSTDEALGDNIFIGNDRLTVNSGASNNTSGFIRWELTNPAGGLDLTGMAAFKANVENGSVSSNSDAVDASLTLVSGIGTMSEMTHTVMFDIEEGDLEILVDIADFVGSVDLTDIDAIVFGYSSPEDGVDFTLSDALLTTTVPVPGGVLLMGSALAAFAARRRRA